MKEWTIASDTLQTPGKKINASAAAVGFHLNNALNKETHPDTFKLIFPNTLSRFIA